eukprot:176392-Amphidinium_carterae.1
MVSGLLFACIEHTDDMRPARDKGESMKAHTLKPGSQETAHHPRRQFEKVFSTQPSYSFAQQSSETTKPQSKIQLSPNLRA